MVGGLYDWSVGYDINASAQVVGASVSASGWKNAVLWSGSVATELGTLGGYKSEAYSINDFGTVIGMSDTADNLRSVPFIYMDETMYSLEDLLIPGSGVTGLRVNYFHHSINNEGQIAASGVIGGELHALILNPVTVPEPSILALFGSAWVWLLGRRPKPQV